MTFTRSWEVSIASGSFHKYKPQTIAQCQGRVIKVIRVVFAPDGTCAQLTYEIKKEFACKQVIDPNTIHVTCSKDGQNGKSLNEKGGNVYAFSCQSPVPFLQLTTTFVCDEGLERVQRLQLLRQRLRSKAVPWNSVHWGHRCQCCRQ